MDHSEAQPSSSQVSNAPSSDHTSPISIPKPIVRTGPSHQHSVASLHRNASNSSGHPVGSLFSIGSATRRHSIVDSLQNLPSSPRSARHPSLTQSALQELISKSRSSQRKQRPSSVFEDRNLQDVTIGELALSTEFKWATMDTTIEDAANLLLKTAPVNVVLVADKESVHNPITTFDFKDLNTYLLVIIGIFKPDEHLVQLYNEISSKVQIGQALTLRDIYPICRKESLVALYESEKIQKAIEVLGSGIRHTIVINEQGDVSGVLDQLRILEFFWNEGVNFPVIENTYSISLQDLKISSINVISVNQDQPLTDALRLMYTEDLNSVAVVDNNKRVVGNISTVDVKHLTSATSAHLMQASCLNFISVILNEHGVDKGQDSFPVFYVSIQSLLYHTIAKLVATQSHHMWIVDCPPPANSNPTTPSLPHKAPPVTSSAAIPAPPASSGILSSSPGYGPSLSSTPNIVPGKSGKLVGVVSLSDVLSLFAKTVGLNVAETNN